MTDTQVSIFDQDLPQTPANHAPISPLSFIERTAWLLQFRLLDPVNAISVAEKGNSITCSH